VHTYTSLWVSTNWKVGLHLQQRQHIKSPLSAWQARHDVTMSARVAVHTSHKGLQLLQLNLHEQTTQLKSEVDRRARCKRLAPQSLAATICMRGWEMRKCSRVNWNDHPVCMHMQRFCAKPGMKPAVSVLRAHALHKRVCVEEASTGKPVDIVRFMNQIRSVTASSSGQKICSSFELRVLSCGF